MVYRIHSECGKVHVSETGRPMQDRIKEHERDIQLAPTQTSTVSEHTNNTGHNPLWNKVKLIGPDPHWYKRRVKEAIHIRIHPNKINRDSRIDQETQQQENRTTAEHRGKNKLKHRGLKCTNHSC